MSEIRLALHPDYPAMDIDDDTPAEVLDNDSLFGADPAPADPAPDPVITDPQPDPVTTDPQPDPAPDPNPEPVQVVVTDPLANLPAEFKEKWVKDGLIDGKFKTWDEFMDYHHGIDKLRGKQAQELGQLRKIAKQIESKSKTYEETLQAVHNGIDKKIDALDLIWDEEHVPRGLSQEQAIDAREYANERTQEELSAFFHKKGKLYPTTQEDWDMLRSEDSDLYDLANTKRKDYLTNAVLFAREVNSVESNLSQLQNAAAVQARDEFHNLLKNDFGFDPQTNPDDINDFVKEAAQFIQSVVGDPSREPVYWNRLRTGHLVPREDFVSRYLLNERKDAVKTLSESAKEPAVEPVATPHSDSNEQILASAIQGLQEDLSKYKIVRNFEDKSQQDELQNAVNKIWAEKTNPLYWDGGTLKKDALTQYFWVNHREDLINQMRSTVARTASEDATRKTQEFLHRRQQGPDFPSTIASDLNRVPSRPGAEVPLPTPEEWNNPIRMNQIAKSHGFETEDQIEKFWADMESRVQSLPPQQRKFYETI